jgi:hypothetical protein
LKLPNIDRAIIPQEKIVGYLLSFKHHDGRSKADFFTKLGFTTDAWQDLAKALLRHADDNKVAKTEDSPFGTRYIIEGEIVAPKSKTAAIRSVWFVETGKHIPRFVTSYPLQRRA